MTYGPWPSCSHSAHIGREVVVHYPRHPFFGRPVRAQYSEQRAGGRVVHVEFEAGVATVLPEWMFNAGIRSVMTVGTPRLSADALVDLHRLLQVRGFRRSSSGDIPVSREQQDGRADQVSQEPARVDPDAAAQEHRVRVGTDSRVDWLGS